MSDPKPYTPYPYAPRGVGKSAAQAMSRFIRASCVVSGKAPSMQLIAVDELSDFAKLEVRVLAVLSNKEESLASFTESSPLPQYTGAPGGLGIVADLPTTARMGCPWRADGPSPRPHPGDQGPSYGPHKDRGHPRA